MTISSSRRLPIQSRRSAFTLAEVMVTSAILAVVLASIIPTFAFFSKSVAALGNYAIMSGESRKALELFGRDLHAAEDLKAASANELTVQLPAELGESIIHYKYDASARSLTREKSDSSGTLLHADVLLEDAESFKFVYYNRLSVDVSGSASILAEAKSVQINAKLQKRVITSKTSDYIISARFLMRNFN